MVAVMLAFSASLPAYAASSATFTDEVGGLGLAARADVSLLNSAWQGSVTANGGTAQAPAVLPSGTITSLPAAADGTTTVVTRTRYSTAASPVFVGPSSNQGTGTCVANGATAGAGLQGGAPRPTALIGGSATCPNGFAYGESGGVGENTTRDAVEFTFSRPILGFGAWFGDLETRTDGQGVAAVVRLFGVGGVLLSDQVIVPGPTYLPQSLCGGTYTGCGNNTTRWVGFVADPAAPVVRMVVIVGDDDAGGDATGEGMSFIGPTFDLSTASLALSKTADPLADTNGDGRIGAGDIISYRFVVTNTGTLAVSSVAITDPQATGLSCPSGSLAAGASRTCTGSHIITQGETNAGAVTNTATATAAVYGGVITSAPSAVTTVIGRVSSLGIVVAVDAATYAAVGDVLTYDTTVTNNGNVTITGVDIDSSAPGLGAFSTTCGSIASALEPGTSVTCAATYSVTQQDIDSGLVGGTSSTTGVTPTGSTVGPTSDTATSTAVQTASLSLVANVAQPTFDAAGDVLDYTITVSNTGNVTLDQLEIVDPAPGGGLYVSTCASVARELAVGAMATCTATYTVTQADLDGGLVTNVANASAQNPAGLTTSAPQSAASSTAIVVGELAITKTVDEPTFDSVGDLLTYTVTIRNVGTAVATSVVATDASPGLGAFTTTCGSIASTLAVNATAQCTSTYEVTQGDLDGGVVTNTARVTAVVGGSPVASPTARADSTAIVRESLVLVSTPSLSSFSTVGQVISYALVLSNGGNVTLSSPEVVATNPGTGAFSSTCATISGPILPQASVSCTALYTITQRDIDAGSVTATANASATPPDGDPLAAPVEVMTTPAVQSISLVLAKSVAEATFNAVGDELHYLLTLTNAGNTTLSAARLADEAPGTGDFMGDCDAIEATLVPGEIVSCSATYVVTQEDIDAGAVTNSARWSADDPLGNPRLSNVATATSLATQVATFDLVMTASDSTFRSVGDVVVFTITLTNTGNVSFRSTTVTAAAPGVGAFTTDCETVAALLAPGASRACQLIYTITASDLAVGSLTQAASASIESSGGGVVREADVELTVTRGAPVLAETGVELERLAGLILALLLGGAALMWRHHRRSSRI